MKPGDWRPRPPEKRCERCDGTGEIDWPPPPSEPEDKDNCPVCGGSGLKPGASESEDAMSVWPIRVCTDKNIGQMGPCVGCTELAKRIEALEALRDAST